MHAGITSAPDHGQFGMLYTSMSRIEGSMEDRSNKGNVSDASANEGGPNHIRQDPPVLGICVVNLYRSMVLMQL